MSSVSVLTDALHRVIYLDEDRRYVNFAHECCFTGIAFTFELSNRLYCDQDSLVHSPIPDSPAHYRVQLAPQAKFVQLEHIDDEHLATSELVYAKLKVFKCLVNNVNFYRLSVDSLFNGQAEVDYYKFLAAIGYADPGGGGTENELIEAIAVALHQPSTRVIEDIVSKGMLKASGVGKVEALRLKYMQLLREAKTLADITSIDKEMKNQTWFNMLL